MLQTLAMGAQSINHDRENEYKVVLRNTVLYCLDWETELIWLIFQVNHIRG